jgi:hypothetical protein
MVSLAPVENLQFKLWRAKAKSHPSAIVSLVVTNGAFQPQAILNEPPETLRSVF